MIVLFSFVVLLVWFMHFVIAPLSEDQQLVLRVQRAVVNHVSIQDVEEYVGRKATLNTTREGDRPKLQAVHIAFYDEKNHLDRTIRKARHVVYWKRPGTSDFEESKYVGVAWYDTGKPKLFTGLSLSR